MFQIQNDRIQDDEISDIVCNKTASDPNKRKGTVGLGFQMHQISKYLHHCNFKCHQYSTTRGGKIIDSQCPKNLYKMQVLNHTWDSFLATVKEREGIVCTVQCRA